MGRCLLRTGTDHREPDQPRPDAYYGLWAAIYHRDHCYNLERQHEPGPVELHHGAVQWRAVPWRGEQPEPGRLQPAEHDRHQRQRDREPGGAGQPDPGRWLAEPGADQHDHLGLQRGVHRVRGTRGRHHAHRRVFDHHQQHQRRDFERGEPDRRRPEQRPLDRRLRRCGQRCVRYGQPGWREHDQRRGRGLRRWHQHLAEPASRCAHPWCGLGFLCWHQPDDPGRFAQHEHHQHPARLLHGRDRWHQRQQRRGQQGRRGSWQPVGGEHVQRLHPDGHQPLRGCAAAGRWPERLPVWRRFDQPRLGLFPGQPGRQHRSVGDQPEPDRFGGDERP